MLQELLAKSAKEKKVIGSKLIPQMMDELTALSYDDLVTQMPEIVAKLGSVLQNRLPEIEEIDTKKGTNFALKYLPHIVEKVVSSDEEVKNELAATEDMTFNVKLGNIAEMTVQIQDGRISFSPGLGKERDFFIDVSTEKLLQILSGKEDALSGFMGGSIEMWREGDEGDMEKAQNLLPFLTVFLEKLRLERMI